MKPLNDMTKRELLAFAEANGIVLSTATKLPRQGVYTVVLKKWQEQNRGENDA